MAAWIEQGDWGLLFSVAKSAHGCMNWGLSYSPFWRKVCVVKGVAWSSLFFGHTTSKQVSSSEANHPPNGARPDVHVGVAEAVNLPNNRR